MTASHCTAGFTIVRVLCLINPDVFGAALKDEGRDANDLWIKKVPSQT